MAQGQAASARRHVHKMQRNQDGEEVLLVDVVSADQRLPDVQSTPEGADNSTRRAEIQERNGEGRYDGV